MQKNNSFYLLIFLLLLFGFLVLHGCFVMYTQEGFEDGKKPNKSVKKDTEENNLDEKEEKVMPKQQSGENNKKTKNMVKKIKVKTFPF